ncbi:MAG: class I SAM-dependent methyltransferase [Ideonella sp.]|nr:class I SAM-dependent methyltransferase [Ideonella sp.]
MQSEPVAADPHGSQEFDLARIYRDGRYLDGNQTWHAEDSPWKANQIMRVLQRNGITPASVCEVGCGAGGILHELSTRMPDIRYTGYETSPQAMALCLARHSQHVDYRCQSVFESGDSYDCLLCIDVFEHVEDYMGFLRKLRTKARFKIFHIPLDISMLSVLHSSMMRARSSVGHLHYFTRDTALATLADCGYRVIDGFFTAPFHGLPARTWKARCAWLPRRALFALSPGLAATVLGGCSYLALAE